MKVPFYDLQSQNAEIREQLDTAIAGVLASGSFVGGAQLDDFEAQFARFCDTTSSVGVASGTDALMLPLMAWGVGPGDEVIVPAMTFIATAEAVMLVGANPVIVDVDPRTGLIDVDACEAAITERTVAVIPVHLWGQTADLGLLRELADRYGLRLLEDAAQAQGATWKGRPAGSVGDAGAFSFYPGKNLGALGEAGAITTSDEHLATQLKQLRDHGRQGKYTHTILGMNARLDTLQAAVLSVKLRKLREWNELRRSHARAYDEGLRGCEAIVPISVAPDSESVYHQYVIRLKDREHVAERLAKRSIGTAVHYPLALTQQPALSFSGHKACPNAELLAGEVLSLPISPHLTEQQRALVIDALLEVVS